MRFRLLVPVVVLLAAAGCKGTVDPRPPTPTTTTSTTARPSIAGSTPGSPGSLPSDTYARLGTNALGSVPFGSAMTSAVLELSNVFRTEHTTESRSCGGEAFRVEVWGELDVYFVDDQLVGYRYHDSALTVPIAHILSTDTGVRLGSTLDDLHRAYADSFKITPQGDGWRWSTNTTGTPGFSGDLGAAPDAGGAVTSIEAGRTCAKP